MNACINEQRNKENINNNDVDLDLMCFVGESFK